MSERKSAAEVLEKLAHEDKEQESFQRLEVLLSELESYHIFHILNLCITELEKRDNKNS